MVNQGEKMPALRLQSLGYLPVPTATLRAESVLNCDLYIQRPGAVAAELYRGQDYPLDDQDLNDLRDAGFEQLYIRVEDAESYRNYLHEHVLHEPDLNVAARLKALQELTRVVFEEAFARGNCDKLVSVASDYGQNLAMLVAQQPVVLKELFHTLQHDYYTFTHVCNVSLYCVLLAHRLGRCQGPSLAELATGALLHDIGKRHVPAEVLNKTGKLTEEEWDLVREHPTTGFMDLVSRPDMTWSQLMVVYQHHERLDGTGYPAAIEGDEIHPWARLCAVVDVFDALTCHRPYRKAMPTSEACQYLADHAGKWFDPDAVRCWLDQVRSS